MRAQIAVLPGDGIGPDVTRQAVRVLEALARRFGHRFEFTEAAIGGSAIDRFGEPLPQATFDRCAESDAVLLGAVGGTKWNSAPSGKRPEDGLLALRRRLELFANLRPVALHPAAAQASPLKPERLRGVDLLIVRELTGGIYFGAKHRSETDAYDLCSYTRREIERIIRVAARLAAARRGRLTSVDKANVLETSRLWRAITERVVRSEFPGITLEHMLVDAAAMHLINRPSDFDVIVTENMFGDILTDESSVLAGSIGLLPSASMGEGRFGLFEPIHGSAPDLAGRNVANPYAAILSAAMLLRLSLQLEQEASAVEHAVHQALEAGELPADLAPAGKAVTTEQAGDAVIARLPKAPAANRAAARSSTRATGVMASE